MSVQDHDDLIVKAAETFRLDANLIRAIVKQESGGNEWVTRYEPAWSYFYTPRTYAENLYITAATETIHQATSWGLMQVMGSVARELGFSTQLTMLTQPDVGLFYGCKKLKSLYDKYGAENEVISAYNAGSVRMVNGFYSNTKYVDSVCLILRDLRGII